MDDETDAAREYDRLRAELADFVMDALAQRVAEGQQPQLSQALVEAIDRRVDQALSERIGRVEWPDPDAFADSVIAAAAARGGGGGGGDRIETSATRARRNSEGRSTYRDPPERERRMGAASWLLIGALAVGVIVAAIFLLPRFFSAPTNTVVMNVAANAIEPTPDGAANAQQPPPANSAVPTSAGADVNMAGQTP
jgi:hypothetical protein